MVVEGGATSLNKKFGLGFFVMSCYSIIENHTDDTNEDYSRQDYIQVIVCTLSL